jgi:D-alanyl-D-alanine carboxypeptidase
MDRIIVCPPYSRNHGGVICISCRTRTQRYRPFFTLLLSLLLFCGVPWALAAGPEIVIDGDTGAVLHAQDAGRSWYPASLAKMMTLYLAFQALAQGELSPYEQLTISPQAAAQPPTSLGLQAGDRISVQEALLATATASANDTAVALAERIAGDEEAFAEAMTRQAAALGMTGTRFGNATGLPDPRQRTTARDMALLAYRLLHDFPERFPLFSHTGVSVRGQMLIHTNQHFLEYPGADGIKTGFTCDSGYNLAASQQKDGLRLIGVVLGAASDQERFDRMVALLQQGRRVATNGQQKDSIATWEGARPDHRPPETMTSLVCGAGGRNGILEAEGQLPGWGILLGVYRTRKEALDEARHARSQLTGNARNSRIAILPRRFERGTSWKALLVGLSWDDLGGACLKLRAQHIHCVPQTPQTLNQPGYAKR